MPLLSHLQVAKGYFLAKGFCLTPTQSSVTKLKLFSRREEVDALVSAFSLG